MLFTCACTHTYIHRRTQFRQKQCWSALFIHILCDCLKMHYLNLKKTTKKLLSKLVLFFETPTPLFLSENLKRRVMPHRCQTEQWAGQFPVVSGSDDQPDWVDILRCSGGILTDVICASKCELWNEDHLETNDEGSFRNRMHYSQDNFTSVVCSLLLRETLNTCGFILFILKDNQTHLTYQIMETLVQLWAIENLFVC